MMLASNCTQPGSPKSLPSSYKLSIHIPLTTLHCIDILLAIILNSIVLRFFIIGRIKKTSFTILLMNLTIADLATVVGFIPYITVSSIKLRNVSQTVANYLCTITEGHLLFWIPNTVSVLTVMTISINRYIRVCRPVHRIAFYINKSKVSYSCIGVIWLLAIILNVPNFISRQYHPCAAYCERVWPKHFSGTGYTIATMLLGFILPLFLMTFCFLGVFRSWKKCLLEMGTNACQSRKQALTILGFLIIAYILCWLPFTIYWIMAHALDSFKGHYTETKAKYITLLFGLTNPVIDPLVYGFRLAKRRLKREMSTLEYSRSQTVETLCRLSPNDVQNSHQFQQPEAKTCL